MDPEDVQRISGLDRNARLCSKTAEVNGTLLGWTYEQLGAFLLLSLSGCVPDEYCRMGVDVELARSESLSPVLSLRALAGIH